MLQRLAPLLLLAAPSCAGSPVRNELERTIDDPVENEIIVARDGAKSLDARIAIGAGDLQVRAGACPLMKATARYDARHIEPRVDYWVNEDFRGKLDFGAGKATSQAYGDWRVCLTDSLPVSLSISHGAGDTDLDLGDLQLDELDVRVKAGDTTIDLVGRRYRNTKVKLYFEGDAGDVTLRVPKAVGVRVEVEQAAGSFDSEFLHKRDGDYVNDAFGKTPVTLEISIKLMAGNLEIEAV